MTLAVEPRTRVCALLALAAVGWTLTSTGATSGSIKDQLAKLDPEERAHQACVIKGIDTIKHDRKLPGAESMKTSIFGRASFTGDVVTAKGGAVRAHNRWYKLAFNCTVTADQMKATVFTYEIGAEIPPDKWEDLGLW